MTNIPSGGYSAAEIEAKWYELWEKADLFTPDPDSSKPAYSITLPPPNVTGSLHMGHALGYSLHDLLARYKRMKGFRVLVLPGQDHAGIATQSVVIKKLKKEGINPLEIGREAFIEKVWEWRNESGGTILRQGRSLGCSFDWSRSRFTLDPDYVKAVHKAFIDWYDRGLIYKGLRVVNWDPTLQTSVSDIETERQEINGKLYHVKYPFADGSGHVVIATTRPETILADIAVAVHPSDTRYKGLVGKKLVVPIVSREIPLIEDIYPDPEFGTGAVKITPAHDANDFEVAQRHGLEVLFALDPAGNITELGGKFKGLNRQEGRKQIVAELEATGLLEKVEDHKIAILISDRSKDVIEPYASEQWFVDQKSLADQAIQVVESGNITYFPERYKEIYLDWMRNIRDWCISRQLWWGHRIPVYYTETGKAVAAESWEAAELKAGAKIVSQEEDVLDTWFSSGLWPFATMGWPAETDDLKHFYPTDVLITARDIIFLWVARMIIMGMDFQGQIPFKDVFIHATVLTEDGKRMSKSLGTGVDPMEVIADKGADALRYTLLSQTGTNQDIRYSERKTTDGRNFCSKIWNASRFVLMNLEGFEGNEPTALETTDEWILSRLALCEQTTRKGYETYDIQSSISALYEFFWSELCDWYIEMSKSRLADPAQKQTPQWVLLTCLSTFLKMLHPAMPFITEEVYALLPLPTKAQFLVQESWPQIPNEWLVSQSHHQVEQWLEITRALRALRAEVNIPALRTLPQAYVEGDIGQGLETIRTQAWFEQVSLGKPQSGICISDTVAGVDVHLPIDGLVDTEKELERLSKDLAKTQDELEKLNKRLQNPDFVQRAKPDIVEREQAAAEALKAKVEKIEARIKLFSNS